MPKKKGKAAKDAAMMPAHGVAAAVGGTVGSAVASAGKSVKMSGQSVEKVGDFMRGDVPDEDEAFTAVNDSFSNRLEFAATRGKKAVAKELLNAPGVAVEGARDATGGAIMMVGKGVAGAGKKAENAGMFMVPSLDRFKTAKKFKYICVRGAPGAGKGTHAAKLIQDYSSKFPGGMESISTGGLLRAELKKEGSPLAARIKAAQESDVLVPIEVVVECLVARIEQLDDKATMILDGSPRTVEEAEAIVHMIGLPEVCIFLEISEEESLRRVALRKKEALASGENVRADDDPASVKKRYAAFQERSKPVATWFKARGLLSTIKAGSFDAVYTNFASEFEIAMKMKKGAVKKKGRANINYGQPVVDDDAEPASCCAWMFPRGFSGKAPMKKEDKTGIVVRNPLGADMELDDDEDVDEVKKSMSME